MVRSMICTNEPCLIRVRQIDNTTPIGPCLVAAHAIADPQKLSLKTVVNGKTVQDGTTS